MYQHVGLLEILIEPISYDEIVANELYRIEFLDEEDSINERIRHLLGSLRRSNLDLYHNLMQNVMWGQDREAEEWAYRWKSGLGLAGKGIIT